MDKNVEKLDFLIKQAEIKSQSDDLVEILGALTIYAGVVDFFIIQSARLVEQIIAKEQMLSLGKISFQLHENEWFFNKKVFSGRILKEIKKLLPFINENEINDLKEVNILVKDFLKSADLFLKKRNTIIHGIGNPKNSLEEIKSLCRENFTLYKNFEEKHRLFSLRLAQYRLTEEQLIEVYKK